MTSSVDHKQSGSTVQHSEQAVVPHSTQTEQPSLVREKILSAICLGLMSEMMSGDMMWLALHRAERTCLAQGISQDEFNSVHDVVVTTWLDRRKRNPMSGMF